MASTKRIKVGNWVTAGMVIVGQVMVLASVGTPALPVVLVSAAVSVWFFCGD